MTGVALGLLVLVFAVVGALIVRALGAIRRDRQIQALVETFGPLAAQAREHPRRLLAWHPMAERTRRLFPEAFQALETTGERFPFSDQLIESVEANWTAEWLEWERNNDTEYREQSAVIEAALDTAEGTEAQVAARARLDTLERDRLERYQRRYQEYVEVSRGLASLTGTTAAVQATERQSTSGGSSSVGA